MGTVQSLLLARSGALRYTEGMAERNSSMDALILSVKQQGEQNYSVCMLSAELGVFYATLYGGAKSKKRAFVQQFNSGRLYLYTDESHHLKKITDFDVKDMHLSLRTNLYKLWAANLASEIVLKTQCAGDFKNAFILLSAFLDGIDRSTENGARLGTLRFLWRYLALLGVQPDPTSCAHCSSPLQGGTYTGFSNGFLCHDCSPQSSLTPTEESLSLSREALAYLDAINSKSPREVRETPLSTEDALSIKHLTFRLIEQAAGTRLKSLESGMGIL